MKFKMVNLPEPQGTMSLFGMYASGFCMVIGSGIITLLGYGIAYTGYSVVLAMAVAVVLGFVYNLPMAFNLSVFRMGGGQNATIANLISPVLSGILTLPSIFACISSVVFASTFGIYVNLLIPAIPPMAGALLCVIIVFAINMMGLKVFERASKIMTWVMLVALIGFVAFGLPKITSWESLHPSTPAFFLNGTGGFIGAISLFMYMTVGYSCIAVFSLYGKDPRKDCPRSIVLCFLSLLVLYCGMALVNIGVMPLGEAAGQPLGVAARIVFPTVLYYIFMIGGPLFAIISSLNSVFASVAPTIGMLVDDGWLPAWIAKKNRRGAMQNLFIILAVVFCAIILFDLDITALTSLGQVMSTVVMLPALVAFLLMPTKCPSAWKAARWHVPNWLYYIIWALGTAVCLWNGISGIIGTSLPLVAIVLAAYILMLFYAISRSKKGVKNIYTRRLWTGLEHDEIDDFIAAHQ